MTPAVTPRQDGVHEQKYKNQNPVSSNPTLVMVVIQRSVLTIDKRYQLGGALQIQSANCRGKSPLPWLMKIGSAEENMGFLDSVYREKINCPLRYH
jgi:hypothetical protein